jgi:HTH-type transcriptional regulator/antitoxin HigA
MEDIRVIKSKKQYKEYTNRLIKLWEKPTDKNENERELLELLIDDWERNNLKSKDVDPIELIKFLMENHNLERKDMMKILGINKGTLSKILSYKKGLSKEIIRSLSEHFKVAQEAFNRAYPLKLEENKGHKNEKMMNTRKEQEAA